MIKNWNHKFIINEEVEDGYIVEIHPIIGPLINL